MRSISKSLVAKVVSIIPLMIAATTFDARVSSASTALSTSTEPSQTENAEWKARMGVMLNDVLVLFPFAFDEAKFGDPKNSATIQDSLKALSQHASELNKHTTHIAKSKGLKIDPSFPFIADAFAMEVQLASDFFSAEPKSLAKSQGELRSALSKCILCHTQSQKGSELKLDQFNSQLTNLSSSDRFTALTVTRQFDAALSEFQNYTKISRMKKPDAAAFDRNTRTALAILVRVKRDPKRTMALLDQIAEADLGSNMTKSNLKGWRKSVLAWAAEKPSQLTSDKALFDEANRLLETAKKQQTQIDEYDDSSIYYLRASAQLHDLLSTYQNSQWRAKSYIALASIYGRLPGFSMWDMGDEYLGACIRENAHSEMGESCFSAYEENIKFGYTGSSGTHIPGAVQRHLQEMKKLAQRLKSR